jgi:hypothetical protein
MKYLTLSTVVAAAALSGCVVAPYPQYGYAQPAPQYGGPQYQGDAGVVMQAPPVPQYEAVGVAPFLGAVWIGGFWNWSGGRYTWVGGHWDHGRPGYHYVPHRWEPVAHGGWRQQPGRWERERG